MIIYSANKRQFLNDEQKLPDELRKRLLDKLGEDVSDNEMLSWKNSLWHMKKIMEDARIPDDAGIAVEYNIPVTNNRIDFVITGIDGEGASCVLVIELKQWSNVEKTDMDGIVRTRYQEGLRDTIHPSYQAFTYCMLLQDYKEAVQKHLVKLKACAYLHNCEDGTVLRDTFYDKYTKYVPVFCRNDADELRNYIFKYIKRGDNQNALFQIEDSAVEPSKALVDSICSMMKGNREFRLVDGQKVAYQNILKALDVYEQTGRKQVVIVEGGPGTGKSVIAINLLQYVVTHCKMANYVSKNAAPRNVFNSKLQNGGMSSSVKTLFKSSTAFAGATENQFDMLVVDEAHRLTDKDGSNQVAEIERAAKVSVFFIDEAQRVSLDDAGSIAEIEKCANANNANVTKLELKSQFRCGGSDVYLQWLDDLLGIRSTGQKILHKGNYDFRVMDTPTQLMDEIKRRNEANDKSRVVAGYCWEWKSRKNRKVYDICFPQYGFSRQWNFWDDSTWCITPGSVEQIGCIHTCQGLEFDYVGVIIGLDILCRSGEILVNPSKRSPDDFTIRGYKEMMKTNQKETQDLVRQIIKNTYRTLMSRGQKGCYVYVMDDELREYIRSRLI